MEIIHNPVLLDYDLEEFARNRFSSIDTIIQDRYNQIEDTYNIILDNFVGTATDTVSFYQKDIVVEQLDENGNGVHAYRLIGAYPVNVDDVQLNDSEGEVSQTNVTFAYTNIELVY
jgi:hypothetical protein